MENFLSYETLSSQQRENAYSNKSASKRRVTGSAGSASKRPALVALSNRRSNGCHSSSRGNLALQEQVALPLPPQIHVDPIFMESPRLTSSLACSESISFFNCPPASSSSSSSLSAFSSTHLMANTSSQSNSFNMSHVDSSGYGSNSSFSLSASFRSLSSSFASPESPMLLSPPNPTGLLVDIDLQDSSDTPGVGQYARDIFTHLKQSEILYHPNPTYMHKQPDITNTMRSILVDWLVEVAEEFRLDPQTFFLAVSYADRYLSCVSVMRAKLQLVGTATMYLASKFEEIYPPEIGEFAYITDDTYTKKQIVSMEQDILKVLNFQLATPTVYTFLQRYLRVCVTEIGKQDAITYQVLAALSQFLCELALQDGDPFLKYLPSVIAASAVCLARHTLGLLPWPTMLQFYSDFQVSDISQCLQDLHRTHAMSQQHPQQAIRTKYTSDKFFRVTGLKSPETLPC